MSADPGIRRVCVLRSARYPGKKIVVNDNSFLDIHMPVYNIVPSSLRKQWNQELLEKFFLPAMILETKFYNQHIKQGDCQNDG
jgi:hypothetical protein